MDIILYNPLSKNGDTEKSVLELINLLQKSKEEVEIKNIIEIINIKEFLSEIHPDDRIIIVGGDGTIHRLANRISGFKIKNPIYIYSAGTGNDFVRSIKTKEKLIQINDYIEKLPYAIVNEKKNYFINGVGIGLDGLVCYKVNSSTEAKNSWNYFKNTIRAFMESKKIKEAKVKIDGKDYIEKRVWLCATMNSKYLGGGMKLAPKANRESSDLYLVVIKRVPKWLLVLILPSVYLGWHTILKGLVKIYKVTKEVEIDFSGDNYLQMDGEVEYPVKKVYVKAYSEEESE